MRTLAGLCAALVALSPALADDFEYPTTQKVDVVDEYHGTPVPDPYRWLEEDVRESQRVEDWVEAQNDVTFGYLRSIPGRDRIADRITQLWDYERYSAPSKIADYYVYSKNDGLQNQSVVYRIDSLDGTPEVLIDPNAWSEDGTVALSGMSFSDDGRYVAVGRSSAGSDWKTWNIMDVERGAWLPETLDWIKWTAIAWTKDGRGFFYTRFPEVPEEEKFTALNINSKIYYHRIGTDQSEDVLVFERPDEPKWGLYAQVTDDGRYLVINASIGTDDVNRVWVRDLEDPYAAPVALVETFDNAFDLVGNEGAHFYFRTDHDAPNRRVVRVDIREGLSSMEEVIPERPQVLRSVSHTGNMLVCSYLKDVLPEVRMHRLDGSLLRTVDFPGIGSGGGFGGKPDQTEVFYSFSSYNLPPSIYRYDMITGESELFRTANVDFDPDAYVVKQVKYRSKDGTQVPMFIAHKKGVTLDGTNPTLLYGYGGFNISLTPGFSVIRLAWMEMGGVYAVANLRGGGEYGKAWHEAGKKLNKQNVFDDFIAAAEFLIDEGYTSPEKLAIQGGSNGGLLVGACMVQRPELFGVALPAVGVMDMIRFPLFTAGRYWTDDYGDPQVSEEFGALFAYSPYHNLQKGVSYPATLVTTADTDDRVVPGHSFKFAARLQEYHRGDAPVMIRIQTDAGHGAGKPTKFIIEEYADIFAFCFDNMGERIPR
ncbi:MAG: prolyl oligopeptidase family serine peptidase [Phycisphaerales bacterium]